MPVLVGTSRWQFLDWRGAVPAGMPRGRRPLARYHGASESESDVTTILAEFVASGPVGGALVLKGGPGAGKTTLWEAGRDGGSPG